MNRYYDSADIVKKYAKYRPRYTAEFADIVLKYYNAQIAMQNEAVVPCKLDLMVDVGCGSGQSTNIFHPYLRQILGIDISREQIKYAKNKNNHDNIRYLEGCAEAIPVKDHSVDILLSATAVHWFDVSKFFKEANRVLKPKTGCLVIACCVPPTVTLISNPDKYIGRKTNQLLKDVLFNCSKYLNQPKIESVAKNILSSGYADIFEAIPYDTKQRNDHFHLQYPSSVADVCHWLSSIDVYHLFMKRKIVELQDAGQEINEEIVANIDPLSQLREDLLNVLGLTKDSLYDKVVKVDHKVHILLASKNI